MRSMNTKIIVFLSLIKHEKVFLSSTFQKYDSLLFDSCVKWYFLTPLHVNSGDDTKEVSTACINEAIAFGENNESVVQKRAGFQRE